MDNQVDYISFLRKSLREYLKAGVTFNNFDQNRAVILASEIDKTITHKLSTSEMLAGATKQLSGQYPELGPAINGINQRFLLEKKKKIVDEDIIRLIEANELDKALTTLHELNK